LNIFSEGEQEGKKLRFNPTHTYY
jgi:hypothetical protein